MDISHILPGSLHVITGGMKGRKTPQFISVFDQLSYAEIKTQVFKPRCDYRSELHEKFNLPHNYIVSRTGAHLPAVEIDDEKPFEILKNLDQDAQIIGIEEVTLFEQPDCLVEIILQVLNSGKAAIVAGLDKNFRGEPFLPMSSLMAYATTVEKSYGICDLKGCSRLGEYPQRIIDGIPADYNSPIKLVGASEAYEIRCLEHHEVPGKKDSKILRCF
ncbi:MAG: thymidine kinase [Nanoarchaeota archaeon]|nr:thymidine kinase [Nanoarchaeota archaeon]MBU1644410.1 thymidine kinase [Nanoarchaeota archaeon]MBU1977506.1 thymidine kinase [Nanoarchaeota archaeon]